MKELDTWQLPGRSRRSMQASRAVSLLGRWAAAAVLLIAIGYGVGRLSGEGRVDVEQIREVLETSLESSLEPAIRQRLGRELNREFQLALAGTYDQIKGELYQQFRHDLSEFAVGTLAASSTMTNNLLTELIHSINTAQVEDRQWIMAALDQIESQRLYETSLLRNDLETLAIRTGDELQRTKQDFVELLVYGRSDGLVPNISESSNNSNERSSQ